RADPRGAYARRPVAGAGIRGAGHQLRHRSAPRERTAPAPDARSRRLLVARLGGLWDVAVHPVPILLPTRGDSSDPHRVNFLRLHGVWRSLVARVVRDDEAAGSNPVTPTRSLGPVFHWNAGPS